MTQQPNYLYPVEAAFDNAAIIRGMNAFSGAEVLGAPADCTAHDIMVAGQYIEVGNEGKVYRLVTIFRHTPTGILGLLVSDITERLLRELEETGAV